jgi:hypothetical protein
MQESNWVAVIVGVLTVAGTLGGFIVSNWFELRREERQNVCDRDREWRERQLESIAELQVALLAALYATNAALRFNEKVTVATLASLAAGQVPSVPNTSKEQWHQDWENAIQRVAVMSSRTQDTELRRLIGDYLRIANSIETIDNLEEQDAEFAKLRLKVVEANNRAGELYREFDAPAVEVQKEMPQRERWNYTYVGMVKGVDGGDRSERWLCGRL